MSIKCHRNLLQCLAQWSTATCRTTGRTHLQEAIDQLVEEEDNLQNSLEDLSFQKSDNNEKLMRKRAEFERMEQRLMQLKTVKAPYQDELDTLEAELSGLYTVYVNKHRSLEYLEAELAKIHRCCRHGMPCAFYCTENAAAQSAANAACIPWLHFDVSSFDNA